MSWDIYIQDLPLVPSVKEVPNSHVPKPIGKRTDLMAKIYQALPKAEGEGSDWIFLRDEGVDMSIQFHMENRDEVRYLLVHVFGGDQSSTYVSTILRKLELRALDTETGEFFCES